MKLIKTEENMIGNHKAADELLEWLNSQTEGAYNALKNWLVTPKYA